MSASLAFQKFAKAKLSADEGVTALVAADAIVDANARPEVFPRIVLGEDIALPADDTVGRYTTVAATLHIWKREPGLAGAKEIAGAVQRALRGQLWTRDGYRCIDCKFQSARFIRDPDGETAHGIVTFEAVIEELGY